MDGFDVRGMFDRQSIDYLSMEQLHRPHSSRLLNKEARPNYSKVLITAGLQSSRYQSRTPIWSGPYSSQFLLTLHHPGFIRLRCNSLLVGINVSWELLHRAMVADPETRADRLQHRHIVRHHEHASLELIEGR